MLKKKVLGAVFAFALIAVASVITATGAFAIGPPDRPFTAPVTGTFQVGSCTPSYPHLICDFELYGEGNATHMGDIVVNSTWVVQIDNALTGVPPTEGSILSGSATITAANGDTVELVAVPGSRLDNGIVNAPFDIVGGTGRFTGATGSVVRNGVFAIVDPVLLLGEFDVTYEGVIGY